MSAVNSLQPPSSPGAEQRPYEPSMEEILASIRRIIADDQPLPPVREPEARVAAPKPEAAPAIAEAEAAVTTVQPEPSPHPPVEEPPHPEASIHVLSGPAPVAPHGHIAAPQFPVMPEGTMAPPADEPDEMDAADLGSTEEMDAVIAPASTVHDHAYAVPRAQAEPQDEVPYDALDADRRTAAVNRRSPAAEGLFSEATDHSVTAAFNALAASRLADNSEELLGIARDMIRPLLKAWIDDNLPSMVERMVRAEIERVSRGGR